MTGQPFDGHPIEAVLKADALPDLPERLSAERLWQVAAAGREPRLMKLRAYRRADWAAAPPLLGTLAAP